MFTHEVQRNISSLHVYEHYSKLAKKTLYLSKSKVPLLLLEIHACRLASDTTRCGERKVVSSIPARGNIVG